MSGEAVETILNGVREAGYRLTPQRREIVQTLASFRRPVTAQEVHRRVSREQPNLSLDTVYRTLRLLAEIGFAHEMNVRGAQERRYHLDPPEDHHHHLVCLDCGKTISVGFCPLDLDAWELPVEGFRVVSHLFETYGYCGACQS